MTNLKKVAENFQIDGAVTAVAPMGNGLINDTYRVDTTGTEAYVLQRINNAIFTDVELLQSNIDAVTRHIRSKLQTDGAEDIERKVLRFLPCKATGKTYYFDGENYWRMSVLIPDAFTFDTVNEHYAECAGKAFGRFQAMLVDIPETLGETIPRFHDMELRLEQLREAIAADRAGRLAEVQPIVDDLLRREQSMTRAEQLHRQGLLPKRVCHCDTKVNNMLFDAEGNVLCVIDLDTVMPSFVFSDFGDFLRTAANTVAEDCQEIDRVAFRREIYDAFRRGYLSTAGEFLTPVEIENLPFATALFPYMQAVRFLTDYINGDTYYKIAYPTHNLVRTRNQVRLLECVEEALGL